jgi:hypothetical protein
MVLNLKEDKSNANSSSVNAKVSANSSTNFGLIFFNSTSIYGCLLEFAMSIMPCVKIAANVPGLGEMASSTSHRNKFSEKILIFPLTTA